MDRNRPFFSGGNRINCKFGSCIDVPTNKNIRFCCLISKCIRNSTISTSQFHLTSCKQIAPDDRLTYREEDMLTFDRHDFFLIILWMESSVRIFYRNTFFQHNSTYFAIFIYKNFFRSPARIYNDSFPFCLFYLFHGCRHCLSCLQTEHIHSGSFLCTPHGISCNVNCNISSTDHNDISFDVILLLFIHFTEQINRCRTSLCSIIWNARKLSTLTSDCDIECFISLCAKLV